MPTQKFTQQDVDQLSTWFQRRYEAQFAWSRLCSIYQALPGLRGFWPMSAVAYTNPIGLDQSGNANHLTNQNSSDFGYTGLVPHVSFDGINQYLSKADGGAANWADITGTEAYIEAADRGLTIYTWAYFTNAAGAQERIVEKNDAAGGAYGVLRLAAGNIRFRVDGGGGFINVDSVATPTAGSWYFLAGRYIPSTSLDIFVNSLVPDNTNLVGIPAAIQDVTAPFTVGASGVPGTYMTGKQSAVALCAVQHTDVLIGSVFSQTQAMFGV